MKQITNLDELKKYHCEKCNDKGGQSVPHPLDPTCTAWRECECAQLKRTAYRIQKSGLEPIIDTKTFETFAADEPWQAAIKEAAQKYAKAVKNGSQNWFMICGQVGAGKSHLAIAIVRELMYSGFDCEYKKWREMALELMRNQLNDEARYYELLEKAKNVKILYIDDFLKGNITDGFKNVAYDVIDGRYCKGNITIITSEKSTDDLRDIDEAIGSRIYEMTKGNYHQIRKDANKNIRFKTNL